MKITSKTERLIVQWREGDESARDEAIAHLLPELEQIAAARLRREDNSSLSTHDLVNDALERLLNDGTIGLANRAHFFALAARLMRNILVDRARARDADKRKHQKVTLHTGIGYARPVDLFALDSALLRLGAIDQDLMELVEMRYFAGMTLAEIAEVAGYSETTAKRRWRLARAWLADALTNPVDDA